MELKWPRSLGCVSSHELLTCPLFKLIFLGFWLLFMLNSLRFPFLFCCCSELNDQTYAQGDNPFARCCSVADFGS